MFMTGYSTEKVTSFARSFTTVLEDIRTLLLSCSGHVDSNAFQ